MNREDKIEKLKNGSDTAKLAADEINKLDEELSSFKNQRNWTRSYDCRGELIKEFALYIPRLK